MFPQDPRRNWVLGYHQKLGEIDMNPVLSISLSRRLKELVGEVETQFSHCISLPGNFQPMEPMDVDGFDDEWLENFSEVIPAPSFSELIRLLPAIGEKLGWSSHEIQDKHLSILAVQYMVAPTPQEGMEKVEAYLEKLLV